MSITVKTDRLIDVLRAVKKLRKQVIENGARSGDLYGSTPRQRELAAERARVCAIDLRRLEHEAHCLAVEIGIADPRSGAAYESTTAPAGMGRDFIVERRRPEI